MNNTDTTFGITFCFFSLRSSYPVNMIPFVDILQYLRAICGRVDKLKLENY